jgi:hypothetical protein
MTFTVLWNDEAFESITKIIDAAGDPDQIIAAVRNLDLALTHDPGTKGESRPDGRRIVFARPLAALIEIHWRMNEVVIGDIWKFETHDSP